MDYATANSHMVGGAMIDALQAPRAFRPVEAAGAQQAARMLTEPL
jgi:hypothetical protein